MKINLQPYERAFILAVAMETDLSKGKQVSIIKRYVNAVDRPALLEPMIDLLALFLTEQKKAGHG